MGQVRSFLCKVLLFVNDFFSLSFFILEFLRIFVFSWFLGCSLFDVQGNETFAVNFIYDQYKQWTIFD